MLVTPLPTIPAAPVAPSTGGDGLPAGPFAELIATLLGAPATAGGKEAAAAAPPPGGAETDAPPDEAAATEAGGDPEAMPLSATATPARPAPTPALPGGLMLQPPVEAELENPSPTGPPVEEAPAHQTEGHRPPTATQQAVAPLIAAPAPTDTAPVDPAPTDGDVATSTEPRAQTPAPQNPTPATITTATTAGQPALADPAAELVVAAGGQAITTMSHQRPAAVGPMTPLEQPTETALTPTAPTATTPMPTTAMPTTAMPNTDADGNGVAPSPLPGPRLEAARSHAGPTRPASTAIDQSNVPAPRPPSAPSQPAPVTAVAADPPSAPTPASPGSGEPAVVAAATAGDRRQDAGGPIPALRGTTAGDVGDSPQLDVARDPIAQRPIGELGGADRGPGLGQDRSTEGPSPISVLRPAAEHAPVEAGRSADNATTTGLTRIDSAPIAPGPSALPSAEPGPSRLSEMTATMTRLVENLHQSGETQRRIVIRLDPPELGSVTLELTSVADEIAVAARTDSSEAVRALLRQRVELQTVLQTLGMSLSEFDVKSDTSDEQRRYGASPRRTGPDIDADPGFEYPGAGEPEGAIFL